VPAGEDGVDLSAHFGVGWKGGMGCGLGGVKVRKRESDWGKSSTIYLNVTVP
jgi:hypothetical protein